jgi:hypothetical protein
MDAEPGALQLIDPLQEVAKIRSKFLAYCGRAAGESQASTSVS